MEIALSEKQLTEISTDQKGTSMLTNEQVLKIANLVNKKINLPLLNEKKEEKVFFKLVQLIDTKLYEELPNEYYELIKTVDEGISNEEAELISKRLSKKVNKKVNIPILTEKMEGKFIKMVIGIIVEAMQKNVKL